MFDRLYEIIYFSIVQIIYFKYMIIDFNHLVKKELNFLKNDNTLLKAISARLSSASLVA